MNTLSVYTALPPEGQYPPDHDDQESPEYQTMVACTPQLTTALALDPETISGYLLARGLTPRTLHSRLIQSGDARCDKAQQLVDAMTTCVQVKASNFNLFIAVFEGAGDWTERITSILIDTYCKKRF